MGSNKLFDADAIGQGSASLAATCRSTPTLAVMEARLGILHIAIASCVGALIASLTSARWIAASLWVSSALMLNGAVSIFEDAVPGGFDNPDGKQPSKKAAGLAGKVLALAVALATLGLAVQFQWPITP